MKTVSQVKKLYSKIDWYKQGAAVKPLYISYPWFACSLMKIFGQKIPVKYEVIIFIENDLMDDYISKRSLEKVARYYYKRQRRDRKFIQKLYSWWHKNFVSVFLKLNAKIFAEDFFRFSNKELLSLFKNYTKIYLGLWHEVIFLDAFDFYGETILKEALEKENKNIDLDSLNLLLSLPMPSFLQRKRLKLLEVTEKVLKNKKVKEFIISEKSYRRAAEKYPWLKKELAELSSGYYWLYNDFAVVDYLGPKYFYDELRLLLLNGRKLKEERAMRLWIKNLSKRKTKIIKKHKLSPGLVNTINFLALLGNFRDERKSYNQMAGNTLKKFVLEFSKRSGLELKIIENLFHWEIKNVFNLNKRLITEAESRSKEVFYILKSPTKYLALNEKYGKKLSDYLKKLISRKEKLRGRVAFSGLVKGRVKIIRNKSDFGKMKKGDILVAPNTRPEYVPVMKIAGAIISEEGGLTCHAAIVSRELKVPAIVGVQGAIAALKDGDLIEVDAEKGIVRKIHPVK